MRKIQVGRIGAAVVFLAGMHTCVFASPADQRVELGIDALKTGDYATAQQWLESARSLQSTHPDLMNALGLSYYKLKDYDRAEAFFRAARDTPRKHEAAYYLGKIYQLRGDRKEAANWFNLAAEQYEDLEIQSAADNEMVRISLTRSTGTDRSDKVESLRNFGFLALESSLVDGIVNPDDATGTNDNDTSVVLLAAGSMTLSPAQSPADWKVGGSLYSEKYSDFSAYDVESYNLFSSVGFNLQQHKLETKVSYAKFVLGGEPYLDQTGISLKDSISMDDANKLVLHARYTDVSSPESTYEYNAGDLIELGAELRGGDAVKWRLGVTWREEDREDRERTYVNSNSDSLAGFTSYSRDWVRVRGRLAWKWSPKWSQKLEASFRSAEYQDADIYLENTDDSNLNELVRTTTRMQIKAELSRKITDKLDMSVRLEHLDDDANNDSYDFSSQTVSAGVGYLF